jgi:hypothetical protein
MTPKTRVESDQMRKPAAANRSVRDPTTEKRAPARRAMRIPASAMLVSSTSRSCGLSYCVRRVGYVSSKARLAASSPDRTTSPHSHACSSVR